MAAMDSNKGTAILGKAARKWAYEVETMDKKRLQCFDRLKTHIRNGKKKMAGIMVLTVLVGLLAVFLTNTVKAANETNLYLLSVTTGVSSGKDIQYITVDYKDDKGTARTHYIFPDKDSYSEGLELAASANEKNRETMEERHEMVSSVMGYDVTDISTSVGKLNSYTTIEFLFQPAYTFKEITSIQVFAKKSSGVKGGEWTWSAVRLFQVEQLYGIGMYGYFSDQYYVDFSGKLIAYLEHDRNNYSWVGDELIQIKTNSNSYYRLQTKIDSGKAEYTSHNSDYNFEMEIANYYKAGIESLVSECSYYQGDPPVISEMGLTEAALLEVQYKDFYGTTRFAKIPVITSVIGYAADHGIDLDKEKIVGVAQQGENIAFSASLPACTQIESVSLRYGDILSSNAWTGVIDKASNNGSDWKKVQTKRRDILKRSSSDQMDQLNMTIFKIYKAAEASETVEGTSDTASVKDGALFESAGGELVWYTASEYDTGIAFETTLTSKTMKNDISDRREPTKNSGITRFLIELETDEFPEAGTTAEMKYSVIYLNTKGETMETEYASVQSGSDAFYGYWTGRKKDGSFDDKMQKLLTLSGQKLNLLVELGDVEIFKGISIKMPNSDDDWQLNGLKIYQVDSLGKRTVSWSALKSQETYTDRVFTREFEGELLVDETDIAMLFQSGNTKQISIESESIVVSDRKKWDWSAYRYSMSYDITRKDLGFATNECKYNVAVQVADDEVTDYNEGDCGSKSKFFFQLVFEDGCSGYVEANQQLLADGFRAGKEEVFSINTNRDYGELVAVKIIPDDVSQSSDAYDKLKIDSIKVSKDGTEGLGTEWILNNIGWISIDYQSDVEKNTTELRTGRSEQEMARTFLVNAKNYNVNLLFSITTGDEPFEGYIRAEVEYIDSQMQSQSRSYDVVEAMYDYLDLKKTYEDEILVDEDHPEGYKTGRKVVKSNPEYMLKPNHTDRFYLSFGDIYQLKSITFYTRSSNVCYLDIKNMSVYRVIKKGALRISKITGNNTIANAEINTETGETDNTVTNETDNTGTGETDNTVTNETSNVASNETNNGGTGKAQNVEVKGEYIRKDETTPLLYMESDNGNLCHIYNPMNQLQKYTLDFPANEIKIDKEKNTWSSTVAREPASINDVLNVFIFPNAKSAPVDSYVLKAAIRYTTLDGTYQQKSVTGMRRSGNMLYAIGISASKMSTLTSIELGATSDTNANPLIAYAVVQQVRGNVVINTYYLNFGNENVRINQNPISPEMASLEGTGTQTVMLSLGEGTLSAELTPEKYDMVACIKYTMQNDPSNTVYDSKYIYLTDQQVESIKAGDVVELTFKERFVNQIKGITLQSTGTLPVIVSRAVAVTSRYDSTAKKELFTGWYDFNTTIDLSSGNQTMEPTNSDQNSRNRLVPVKFTFKTADKKDASETGTDGKIRMTINYLDLDNNIQTESIEDLTQYTRKGSYASGDTAEVMLLVKGMKEIRWIRLEPVSNTESKKAEWTLESVIVEITNPGSVDRTAKAVNRVIYETNPDSGLINIISMGMSANVEVYSNGQTTGNSYASQNGSVSVLLESGQNIVITPMIEGSRESCAIKEVTRVVDGAKADAKQYLTRNDTDGKLIFTPPENEKNTNDQYKIVLASSENPNMTVEISVTVSSKNQKSIAISATANLYENNTFTGVTRTPTDGKMDIYMKSGQSIEFTPAITGSSQGYVVKEVSQIVKGEQVNVRKYLSEDIEKGKLTFTPPANYKTENDTYRITIASRENQEITVSAYITVEPKKITLSAKAGIYENNAVIAETDTTTDGRAEILLKKGQSLVITPAVTDSSQGYTVVKAKKIEDGAEQEASQYLVNDGKTITFTPPENSKDTNDVYQIVIASSENPEVTITISVTLEGVTGDDDTETPDPGTEEGGNTENP